VIVPQIDIHGVLTVEYKSDPPVSRNGNRRLSLPITYKRWSLQPGKSMYPASFAASSLSNIRSMRDPC